jgi:hypothetical protein
LPEIYQVTGGGTFCSGSVGISIHLSGSQQDHNYELYLDEQPTGIFNAGTGEPISFDNVVLPGLYTVFAVSNPASCSNLMDGTATVTVLFPPGNPPVVQGPDYIDLFYTSESEYAAQGSVGATSHEWMLDPASAGEITFIDDFTIMVSWNMEFTGEVMLTARGLNECGPGSWTEPMVITVDNTVGYNDGENLVRALIYPNPNMGNFKIEIRGDSKETFTMRILNSIGESILEESHFSMYGLQNHTIECTSLPAGIYFVQISGPSGDSRQKLIVF